MEVFIRELTTCFQYYYDTSDGRTLGLTDVKGAHRGDK